MTGTIKRMFEDGDCGTTVQCPNCGNRFFYKTVDYPHDAICPKCSESFALPTVEDSCIRKMAALERDL